MNRLTIPLILAASLILNFLTAATIESAQSGEWNDPTTWQGGSIPTKDDDVIIQHSVGVTSVGGTDLAKAKSMIVNGTFTYESNRLVVGSSDPGGNPNGGGNSFVLVYGSLIIAGDYSNALYINGQLRFMTGSTFTMTSGFLHVNGNSGNPLSSVAAGTPIVDISDATNFNVTGGTLYILNPHIDETSHCIKGSKNFAGGSSVSFGAYLTPITTNNYTLDPSALPSFQNLELQYISNTVKLELMDVTIKGAISVNNGTLYNPSPTTNIRIAGDLNFGVNGKIEGRIELNGATQQNINPLTAALTAVVFNGDVIANNAQRVKIKLDMEIIGSLIMSSGRFDLNDRTLTLQAPPTNADETRYLVTHDLYQKIGTLKIKNIGNNTLFPVGTETSYAPVSLSATGGDYSVSARPMTIPIPASYSKINLEWDIRRLTGTASVDINVQWNSSDETPDFTVARKVCRLFRYNGTVWVEQSPTTGTTTSIGTVHTKMVESINNFAIYTLLSIVPIPVTFVSFTAKEQNQNALLTWETATEINNAGFAVVKSLDGRTFTQIGFIKGKGNSSSLETYQFIDNQFFTTAYYRLKQIDFDGKTTFTPIVSVQNNKDSKGLVAYPNPIAADRTSFDLDLGQNTEGGQIGIFDMSGRLVFQANLESNQPRLHIPVSDWARGLYILQLVNGTNTAVIKLVKN